MHHPSTGGWMEEYDDLIQNIDPESALKESRDYLKQIKMKNSKLRKRKRRPDEEGEDEEDSEFRMMSMEEFKNLLYVTRNTKKSQLGLDIGIAILDELFLLKPHPQKPSRQASQEYLWILELTISLRLIQSDDALDDYYSKHMDLFSSWIKKLLHHLATAGYSYPADRSVEPYNKIWLKWKSWIVLACSNLGGRKIFHRPLLQCMNHLKISIFETLRVTIHAWPWKKDSANTASANGTGKELFVKLWLEASSPEIQIQVLLFILRFTLTGMNENPSTSSSKLFLQMAEAVPHCTFIILEDILTLLFGTVVEDGANDSTKVPALMIGVETIRLVYRSIADLDEIVHPYLLNFLTTTLKQRPEINLKIHIVKAIQSLVSKLTIQDARFVFRLISQEIVLTDSKLVRSQGMKLILLLLPQQERDEHSSFLFNFLMDQLMYQEQSVIQTMEKTLIGILSSDYIALEWYHISRFYDRSEEVVKKFAAKLYLNLISCHGFEKALQFAKEASKSEALLNCHVKIISSLKPEEHEQISPDMLQLVKQAESVFLHQQNQNASGETLIHCLVLMLSLIPIQINSSSSFWSSLTSRNRLEQIIKLATERMQDAHMDQIIFLCLRILRSLLSATDAKWVPIFFSQHICDEVVRLILNERCQRETVHLCYLMKDGKEIIYQSLAEVQGTSFRNIRFMCHMILLLGQVAEFNNWQDDIREMNTGTSSQDRYVFDDDEAGGKVIDEEPGQKVDSVEDGFLAVYLPFLRHIMENRATLPQSIVASAILSIGSFMKISPAICSEYVTSVLSILCCRDEDVALRNTCLHVWADLQPHMIPSMQKLKWIDQVFTTFLHQNNISPDGPSGDDPRDIARDALQISALHRICDLILKKQMRDDQAYLICKCLQHARIEIEVIGISFYSNYLKMNVKRASEIIYEIFLALSNDPDAEHQILAVGKIIELAQRLSLKLDQLQLTFIRDICTTTTTSSATYVALTLLLKLRPSVLAMKELVVAFQSGQLKQLPVSHAPLLIKYLRKATTYPDHSSSLNRQLKSIISSFASEGQSSSDQLQECSLNKNSMLHPKGPTTKQDLLNDMSSFVAQYRAQPKQ